MSTNLMIMIVLIVLITSIAGIVRARMGVGRDRHALPAHDRSIEAERLREEVKVLKERVAVLERIATDRNHALEHEFERLRDS
jgi:Flp pilus assembly protein CpaB